MTWCVIWTQLPGYSENKVWSLEIGITSSWGKKNILYILFPPWYLRCMHTITPTVVGISCIDIIKSWHQTNMIPMLAEWLIILCVALVEEEWIKCLLSLFYFLLDLEGHPTPMTQTIKKRKIIIKRKNGAFVQTKCPSQSSHQISIYNVRKGKYCKMENIKCF